MDTKLKGVEHHELSLPVEAAAKRPGYTASTQDEARLDRSINLKMDLIVCLLLGAGFMVRLEKLLIFPSAGRLCFSLVPRY